ncbi:unnamed protein product [Phaeothamnion confervicola]
MAQITDAEAIRFANEVLRPLCEEARALAARCVALSTVWFGGINATFAGATDTLEDGRAAQGVSRLTGADVTNAVAQLLGIDLNAEIIQKPCVRQVPEVN